MFSLPLPVLQPRNVFFKDVGDSFQMSSSLLSPYHPAPVGGQEPDFHNHRVTDTNGPITLFNQPAP